MLRFGLIQRMQQNFAVRKPLPDDRMIGEVVEMAVRQPQPDDVPTARGCLLEQGLDRVIRRVKKHRLPGCFIRDQEAIRHRNPAAVRQYNHGWSVSAPVPASQHAFRNYSGRLNSRARGGDGSSPRIADWRN